MPALTAKSVKATVVLSAAEILLLPVKDGQPKVTLTIATAGGQSISADVSSKAVRRACVAIKDAGGADNAAVILQGRLEGSVLTEAGLTAMPRVPKAATAA